MISQKDQRDMYQCECKSLLDTRDEWSCLKHIRRCELFLAKSEFHKTLKAILYKSKTELPTITTLRILRESAKHVIEELEDTISNYEILVEMKKSQPNVEEIKCSKCQRVLDPYDPSVRTLVLNSCTHTYCEPCLLKSIEEALPKEGVFQCLVCLTEVPPWEIKVTIAVGFA
jgi:hypothetical protein